MVRLAAKSLLLLEDNEVAREGIFTILSRQGYSIRAVSNSGQEPMDCDDLVPASFSVIVIR